MLVNALFNGEYHVVAQYIGLDDYMESCSVEQLQELCAIVNSRNCGTTVLEGCEYALCSDESRDCKGVPCQHRRGRSASRRRPSSVK